jgi:FkbM family methyltransferase
VLGLDILNQADPFARHCAYYEGLMTVKTTVLTLVDGVKVVVPDSLDSITSYVLREQEDFFEDELRFVRNLLGSGQKVIDIGANVGVYALPMAQRVGTKGHVWAFEPTSSTAQILAEGIRENAFTHVTLVQKAVSSAPGVAQLSLQHDPEANSIDHRDAVAGETETVCVVTLDECMNQYHWSEIDLIKIDAEGEENNIVRGGRRFFADLSPLVQYELRKNATDMNFGLIREFATLGYDSFRLVPGLGILVAFDISSKPDTYLLNLFCCKADRANGLSARGLLVPSSPVPGSDSVADTSAGRIESSLKYHWRQSLANLPYAATFASTWEAAENAGNSTAVIHGLSLYACSRDSTISISNRLRALEASYGVLNAICEREPTLLRLSSLARAAHDYGERAASVNALAQLLSHIRHAGVDTSEPFLPPLERFDAISPGDEPARWLVAAVLEQLERRERYSSFYAGPFARERLEDIRGLGHGSPEMERRLDLVRKRFDNRVPGERR